MRHYLNILKDIEKYFIDNQLIKDLTDLHDWQRGFASEVDLCSATATWLYTFQVYGNYDETLMNLIDEFGAYCHSNSIKFI